MDAIGGLRQVSSNSVLSFLVVLVHDSVKVVVEIAGGVLARFLLRRFGPVDVGVDLAGDLADLLALLQIGESIGLPTSRPMSVISHGVHELRIKDRSGQYRVFYFTKHKEALLVFHRGLSMVSTK